MVQVGRRFVEPMPVVVVDSYDGVLIGGRWRYPLPTVSATNELFVAASDASDRSKAAADYVCDGTADEEEINAAIVALPVLGGKVVLSEGIFTIAADINICADQGNDPRHAVTLEGQGPIATKIVPGAFSATNAVIYIGDTTPGPWWCQVKNLQIDATSLVAGHGIYAEYGNRIIVENLHIKYIPSGSHGIQFGLDANANGISVGRIINCYIEGHTSTAGRRPDYGIWLDNVDTCYITNNLIYHAGISGLMSTTAELSAASILGNTFSECGHLINEALACGVSLRGERVTFVGNVIEYSYDHGLYLKDLKWSQIVGNTIRDSSFEAANKGYGINVLDCNHLTIVGNGVSGDAGQIVTLINLHNTDYSLVEGNQLDECTGAPVAVDLATCTATRVRGNHPGQNTPAGAEYLSVGESGKLEGWVKHDDQNPTIGYLPANAVVTSVNVWVEEAFDSDGTDLLTVGYDADPDAYVTSLDVSGTGVKSPTMGASAGIVDATSRAVEAYYVNGGTEPSAGHAHVIVHYMAATVAP